MNVIFWISIGLIIYCYFGYPIVLKIVATFLNRPVLKRPIEPSISVVISLWNEADVIRNKIDNLLQMNYPKEKFEILIGSDGSTDATNSIVESYRDPRIRFFPHPQRRGKMLMLNDLLEKATGEIIIFNDARQEIPHQAFDLLLRNFSDPAVGCVSGELVFRKKEGTTAQGVNLYWEYEKFMRNLEAKIHSMLGATGAFYAIRKSLFVSVPRHVVLDDMYIPFKIIEQGYRAVFESEAKAYDNPAEDPKEEYRRKTRTLFGNFQIFQIFLNLFNPLKSPIAIQLISHKFLRILAPFLMIQIFVLNLFMMDDRFYQTTMILQIIFYLSALIGFLFKESTNTIFRKVSKICYVPYIFCLLNISVLVGFWRFITAKQTITWEKARAV